MGQRCDSDQEFPRTSRDEPVPPRATGIIFALQPIEHLVDVGIRQRPHAHGRRVVVSARSVGCELQSPHGLEPPAKFLLVGELLSRFAVLHYERYAYGIVHHDVLPEGLGNYIIKPVGS